MTHSLRPVGVNAMAVDEQDLTDEQDYLQERAAIREYDGNQSRKAAEDGAREGLRRKRDR